MPGILFFIINPTKVKISCGSHGHHNRRRYTCYYGLFGWTYSVFLCSIWPDYDRQIAVILNHSNINAGFGIYISHCRLISFFIWGTHLGGHYITWYNVCSNHSSEFQWLLFGHLQNKVQTKSDSSCNSILVSWMDACEFRGQIYITNHLLDLIQVHLVSLVKPFFHFCHPRISSVNGRGRCSMT